MPIALANARQEWDEAHRRLQLEARDPLRHGRLLEQVEVVTDELRRRIGQTFTLAELAELYDGADRWVREALAERAPYPGWAVSLSLVEGAAFYLYQRGAIDYEP